MIDYKIKSYKTQEILPYGVTLLSQIPKEDISNILKAIHDSAKSWNWLQLVIDGAAGYESHWSIETLVKQVNDLTSDIKALTGKLSNG